MKFIAILMTWVAAVSQSADPGDAAGAKQAVAAWAVSQVRPIDDASWIDEHVNDVRVVMVGEEVHGIAEHIELKSEIVLRLVERHGFTHVALEDDPFKVRAIESFVRSGDRSVEEACQSLYWCWNVSEFRDLISHLRQRVREGLDPVRVIGFDCQSPTHALRSLAARAETDEQRLAIEATRSAFDRESASSREAADVIDEAGQDALAGLRMAFGKAGSDEIAHVDRALARKTATNSIARMDARDLGMFEIITDVLDDDPEARVVVLAHNAHIGRTPVYEKFGGGFRPLGQRLAEAGTPSLVIGAVAAEGAMLLDPRQRDADSGLHADLDPRDRQAETWLAIPHERWVLALSTPVAADTPRAVKEWLDAPPAGYFDNYGPARSLTRSYDLLVGYRRVSPATP
ncbi:MAG: erythromycin esterase family protein [Planctomycetota bacterium]